MNFRAEVCAKALDERERAKNLTPSGRLKNGFSQRQLEFCSRRDASSFQHAHATGDREYEEEIRKKFSSGSKHPLQYRK